MGLGKLNPFKPGSVFEQAAQGAGKGLAELDKGVNKAIPGGWITVGGVATALYFAPEIIAFAKEAGVTPAVASAELGVPAMDATGALINPATGLAWEATGSGLAGNGVQLTAAEFASQAGAGGLTAKDAVTNAYRAKQLANILSPTSGKPNQQQFAQFQQANQPMEEQFGGLYRSNQLPFLNAQTPQIQPLQQTENFLAELSEQGKTNDLATLLRNI
ncbi:MAG: hypothetical protein WCG15_01500 [Actinomycetes bacterium]